MIKQRIQESIETKQTILTDESLLATIQQIISTITDCFRQEGKVFFCGNGGSAADAQHLAAELSGRFYLNRRALPSEALHCNTSYITAVANDYGFEEVYSRLIGGIVQQGDVLIGLSTSGNSINIKNAFMKAKEMGITTIAFTGAGGGALKAYSDILLPVPSTNTPRIQECHMLIGHIICEQVEANLFG